MSLEPRTRHRGREAVVPDAAAAAVTCVRWQQTKDGEAQNDIEDTRPAICLFGAKKVVNAGS